MNTHLPAIIICLVAILSLLTIVIKQCRAFDNNAQSIFRFSTLSTRTNIEIRCFPPKLQCYDLCLIYILGMKAMMWKRERIVVFMDNDEKDCTNFSPTFRFLHFTYPDRISTFLRYTVIFFCDDAASALLSFRWVPPSRNRIFL